jgi:hypothetical protein
MLFALPNPRFKPVSINSTWAYFSFIKAQVLSDEALSMIRICKGIVLLVRDDKHLSIHRIPL